MNHRGPTNKVEQPTESAANSPEASSPFSLPLHALSHPPPPSPPPTPTFHPPQRCQVTLLLPTVSFHPPSKSNRHRAQFCCVLQRGLLVACEQGREAFVKVCVHCTGLNRTTSWLSPMRWWWWWVFEGGSGLAGRGKRRSGGGGGVVEERWYDA